MFYEYDFNPSSRTKVTRSLTVSILIFFVLHFIQFTFLKFSLYHARVRSIIIAGRSDVSLFGTRVRHDFVIIFYSDFRRVVQTSHTE